MSAAEEKPVGETPDLARLAHVVNAVLVTVRDKEQQVRLALAAMLSGGHLLLKMRPAWAKPVWRARWVIICSSIGRACNAPMIPPLPILSGLIFSTPNRVISSFAKGRFTPSFYSPMSSIARRQKPVRAFEVMAERQVTVDGSSFALPEPFIVIATQNPTEQIGVSPLPESQLDRSAVSFSLGLPSDAVESDILRDAVSGEENFEQGEPVLAAGD